MENLIKCFIEKDILTIQWCGLEEIGESASSLQLATEGRAGQYRLTSTGIHLCDRLKEETFSLFNLSF